MNSVAFEENGGIYEIQHILDKLSHRFERSPDDTGGFVKDSNGNTVGDWEIAQPEPSVMEERAHRVFKWSDETGTYVPL